MKKIEWLKLYNAKWYKDSSAKSLLIHIYINSVLQGFTAHQTTVKQLSSDTGLTVAQVRHALKKLTDEGVVANKTTNKYSLLSIENTVLSEASEQKFSKQNSKQNFYEQALNDQMWIEHLAKMFQSDVRSIEEKINGFNLFLIAKEDHKDSLKEYKNHFVNWLKYNASDIKKYKVFRWKWKGQSEKSGTYEDMMKDKKHFDFPGFEFQSMS
jgi:DNA-binding transcriptional regulator YhcF (GntR family)